jgi:ZIP family zinc transporter
MTLIETIETMDPVMAALAATTFTWLVTGAGASLVFFFKTIHRGWLDGMLGFTGGVMIAASCFGLLIPAIDMSDGEGWLKVMPAAVGF